MKCFSRDWCSKNWSGWASLEDISGGKTAPDWSSAPAKVSPPGVLPSEPGIYRIRVKGRQRMAYIGECSDLSVRILGTWRHLNEESPGDFSPDQTAARRLAHLREAQGIEYEISWYAAAYESRRDSRLRDEQWRKGLEAHLLWEYRQDMRVSSIANHGRATLQKGDQLGSTELGVGYPGQVRPSTTPLPRPERAPHSEIWMGRRWTTPRRKEDITRERNWEGSSAGLRESGETVPVLYKAIAPGTDELLRVGYTGRGSAGVREAARRMSGRPLMSWTPLPRSFAQSSYVWQELRGDLIGGYFYQTGEAPAYQFSTSQRSHVARPSERKQRQQAMFES